MNEPVPVEGIIDNIRLLNKYLPLITELRKLPEFWALMVAGQLDKAGDYLKALGAKLGFPDIGAELDDLFGAIQSRSIVGILRSLADGFGIAADMVEGKTTETIRLPVAAVAEARVTAESFAAVILAQKLDKPPTVAAGEPVPVENPLVIIGLIGMGLQALKLIWERRKSKQ